VPARTVVLDDTTTLLHDLSEMIAGFNSLISVNNENVSAGPRKKTDCRNKVFELLAFKLKDVIDAYTRSDTTLDSEIEAQQSAINTHWGTMERLNAELRELNSQTVETETAMDNINTMLRDSGFQGFQIRPRAEEIRRPDGTVEWAVPVPAINYEVIRTDTGEIAENLSEGEKNFIAFLYFQQMVFGSETAEGDNREKIVVIDDPVSSMDSSALFIVSAQVRKMIEICRNNADNRNPLVPGNFIKQIFILTHNAYFHGSNLCLCKPLRICIILLDSQIGQSLSYSFMRLSEPELPDRAYECQIRLRTPMQLFGKNTKKSTRAFRS
jgi:wobble nucleotide-excising tRNase